MEQKQDNQTFISDENMGSNQPYVQESGTGYQRGNVDLKDAFSVPDFQDLPEETKRERLMAEGMISLEKKKRQSEKKMTKKLNRRVGYKQKVQEATQPQGEQPPQEDDVDYTYKVVDMTEQESEPQEEDEDGSASSSEEEAPPPKKPLKKARGRKAPPKKKKAKKQSSEEESSDEDLESQLQQAEKKARKKSQPIAIQPPPPPPRPPSPKYAICEF